MVAAFCTAALAGCGNGPAGEAPVAAVGDETCAQAVDARQSDEPRFTGSPALPLPDAGPKSPTSRIISMEEMSQKFPQRGDKPGCFITFAYAGYVSENLIWDGEPCDQVTALFATPAELGQDNNWDQLDEFDQKKVMASPDQRALYIEGQFSAAIYPLDYNSLTYEIVVSD